MRNAMKPLPRVLRNETGTIIYSTRQTRRLERIEKRWGLHEKLSRLNTNIEKLLLVVSCRNGVLTHKESLRLSAMQSEILDIRSTLKRTRKNQ